MDMFIRDLMIFALLLTAAAAGVGIYGIVSIIREEKRDLEDLIADQADKGLKAREDKDEKE